MNNSVLFSLKDKRWIWVLLGLFAIVIRFGLGYFPMVAETIYSRGLFQVIRYMLNSVISLLPFPTLYLWVIILCFVIGFFFRNLFKNHLSWKVRLYHFVVSLLAFFGGIIFFFLFLWGFNYARIPFEDQVQISPEPLSKNELFQELEIHTGYILEFRKLIPGNNDHALDATYSPNDLEAVMKKEVKRTMSQLGYPTAGPIRVRNLFKGNLLRIGTAGFYLPFTGECNVDAGLHPLQKPYVVAHEFAHGLGIGDEGTCNFIAYLTCTSSDNPFVRYSGNLSFWRSVASSYRAYDDEHYSAFRKALPAGLVEDLNAINENNNRYPDIFPTFRDMTYDAFLKTQGIAEGSKNYSRVILLERAWRLKKGAAFLE